MSMFSRAMTRLGWMRKSDAMSSLELFREIYGWGRTVNGITVTLELALRTSVFLDCCRIISEGCAQVPFALMQENLDTGDRVPARKHPLYRLLARKPNSFQSSFQYREMLVLHAAATGNGYAYKVGGMLSRAPSELLPLDPTRVSCFRNFEGNIRYRITLYDGTSLEVGPERMVHLRGPSWLGYIGMDTIKLAAAALGLANELEKTQAEFVKEGLRPSGTYSVEGNLDEKQHEQIRKFLKEQKKGDPLILDRNAKWLTQTATAIDSQLIESRKFQIEDVCRTMRVMPIMVGYSDKTATYASAEQMFLAHLVHTLTPWYERVEQTHDVQLLTDAELDAGYEFELDEQCMLRGALKDTKDYLVGLTGGGIMTRNEARRRINLNRLPGLDEPLIPSTSPPESAMPDPNNDPNADPNADPNNPDGSNKPSDGSNTSEDN